MCYLQIASNACVSLGTLSALENQKNEIAGRIKSLLFRAAQLAECHG